MRNYPINYEMQITFFEPYKKQWIDRKINLGRCMSKNEAIEKSFSELIALNIQQWKILKIFNEKQKEIYSCKPAKAIL